MKSFLIYCSGANKKVLQECPSEITKFICIGGTVLFTSIFAFISSSYALYRTFSEYYYALYYSYIFGIIWALMIFNLDRYILCSIKKYRNKLYEFFIILPRLFLAVLIAITIAKPLEVKIMENKIIRKIHENKLNSFNNDIKNAQVTFDKTTLEINDYDEMLRNNITKQNELPDHINILSNAYQECEQDYKQCYSEYHKKRQQLKIERSDLLEQYNTIQSEIRLVNNKIVEQKQILNDNPSLTDKHIKALSELKRLEYELTALKEKAIVIKNNRWRRYKLLEELQTSTRERRNECKKLENKLNKKVKEFKNNLDKEMEFVRYKKQLCKDRLEHNKISLDNIKTISEDINNIAYTHTFVTQLEALGTLTKDKYSTMWWVKIMIMILFITIETSPVLLRFISSEGPYDKLIQIESEKEINSFSSNYDYQNKIHQLQFESSMKQQTKSINDYFQMLIESNRNFLCNFFSKLDDARNQKLQDIFKDWKDSKTYKDIEKEFMSIYSGQNNIFLEFSQFISGFKNKNVNNQEKKEMNKTDHEFTQYQPDQGNNIISITINLCLIIFTAMCIIGCLLWLYSKSPKDYAYIATIVSILLAGVSTLTNLGTWFKESIFIKKRN